MTFSPLVDRTIVTTKHSSRRGRKVKRVIVHHWATTNTESGITTLARAKNKKSVNYLILDDGTLIGSVPEEYRAWTSGSWNADAPSITVEVQNSTGAPDWKVSDAAVATLTRLIADVAKRHKFTASRKTVRGHREFAATACPGPYLYPRLGAIAGAPPAAASAPAKPSEPSKPAPSKPKPAGGIAVDGRWGRDTTRALQRTLGTPADGEVWNQNRKWKARNPGLTSGWKWKVWTRNLKGSPVIRAMQKRLGVKADGRIGPATINALSARYGIRGDGKLDNPSITVKALQKALNEGKI